MLKKELATQEQIETCKAIIGTCSQECVEGILPHLKIMVQEFDYFQNIMKINAFEVIKRSEKRTPQRSGNLDVSVDADMNTPLRTPLQTIKHALNEDTAPGLNAVLDAVLRCRTEVQKKQILSDEEKMQQCLENLKFNRNDERSRSRGRSESSRNGSVQRLRPRRKNTVSNALI